MDKTTLDMIDELVVRLHQHAEQGNITDSTRERFLTEVESLGQLFFFIERGED